MKRVEIYHTFGKSNANTDVFHYQNCMGNLKNIHLSGSFSRNFNFNLLSCTPVLANYLEPHFYVHSFSFQMLPDSFRTQLNLHTM